MKFTIPLLVIFALLCSHAYPAQSPSWKFDTKTGIRFKKLEDLNLPAALVLIREASALLENGSTDFSL